MSTRSAAVAQPSPVAALHARLNYSARLLQKANGPVVKCRRGFAAKPPADQVLGSDLFASALGLVWREGVPGKPSVPRQRSDQKDLFSPDRARGTLHR